VGTVEDDAGGGLLRTPSASLDEAQRKQADEHMVLLLLTIAGRSTALLGQRASVVPATGARAFEFFTTVQQSRGKVYSHT
jgi:hypothetical protein